MIDLTSMAAGAKTASRQMAHASTEDKNIALKAIATNLEQFQHDGNSMKITRIVGMCPE